MVRRDVFVIMLFLIGFSYIEASVVVYLQRAFYGGSTGIFPLRVIEQKYLTIEFFREAATILLLLASVMMLVRGGWRVFWMFILLFANWDVLYYCWLRVLTGWPTGPGDWDVLFLIPVPWLAPVYAPLSAAVAMIACASSMLLRRITKFRIGEIALGASGVALVCGRFCAIRSRLWRDSSDGACRLCSVGIPLGSILYWAFRVGSGDDPCACESHAGMFFRNNTKSVTLMVMSVFSLIFQSKSMQSFRYNSACAVILFFVFAGACNALPHNVATFTPPHVRVNDSVYVVYSMTDPTSAFPAPPVPTLIVYIYEGLPDDPKAPLRPLVKEFPMHYADSVWTIAFKMDVPDAKFFMFRFESMNDEDNNNGEFWNGLIWNAKDQPVENAHAVRSRCEIQRRAAIRRIR